MTDSAADFLRQRLGRQDRLHPVRACGGCTMCCKTNPVLDLYPPKAAGELCPHACLGKGCAIYADRPDECRGFACEWILDSDMPDDLKPDRCGFVVQITPDRRVMQVLPDRTLTLGQWRRLVRLGERFAQDGGLVWIAVADMDGDREAYRQFLAPPHPCFVGHILGLDGQPFVIWFLPVEMYRELIRSGVPPEQHSDALFDLVLESSLGLVTTSQARTIASKLGSSP
jgi:hypothetical protein